MVNVDIDEPTGKFIGTITFPIMGTIMSSIMIAEPVDPIPEGSFWNELVDDVWDETLDSVWEDI